MSNLTSTADLYAPGSALRQIGAELGVTATAWDINFARPASPCVATVLRLIPLPQQIRGLRDHGLTWNEVAKQLDMTVSGAWSRYRRGQPPKPPRLPRWHQVLADALDQDRAIGPDGAVGMTNPQTG